MPIPRISLTASQRDDLAATCAVGPEALGRVASKIQNEGQTIRRHDIDDIIKREVGAEAGETVSRFLFGIAGPLRRDVATANDMLNGISRAIDRSFKGDRRFANWPDCVPALLRLLTLPSITLAAKALDISYDFERVYASARFLTSVRPVYNDARDDIVGATIVQTLRLDYVSANGDENSISIAIDLEDIKRLQRACEEALSKADVAKAKFEGKYGLQIIVPGGGMS
jgi:hypothetical protein